MSASERSIRRTTALATWAVIVVGSTLTILALHRLGDDAAFAIDWGSPWTWLGETSPEVVLLALGRFVALALAYWILLSTVAYTATAATRNPALVHRVEWATLPAVRRVAQRAVAVSLSVSSLAAGFAGPTTFSDGVPVEQTEPITVVASDAPTYVPVAASDGTTSSGSPQPDPTTPGPSMSGDPGTYIPVPAGDGGPGTGADLPTYVSVPFAPEVTPDPGDEEITPPPFLTPAGAPTGFGKPVGGSTEAAPTTRDASNSYDYTIRSGDSLWSAAAVHLESVRGRTPSDTELATYWSRLVAHNRNRIRSGDPDLVFPGEVIECPPVDTTG